MSLNAQSYCEVASLSADDIGDVLMKHPFLRERLEQYATLRIEVDKMIVRCLHRA